MEGLLGLTKSINTRESAISDLNVLERMDSRIQSDKNAEVVAQKEEQLMYERMYQMSDKLLEKDRKMINKKISMSQGQITNHLKDAGGSRKRFMEQGGLSVLGNISNDIMRSPEAIRYQENKANLTKILEMKEKGLGHLIAPRDLQSLEEYERNENGGSITYSGVMSEIEIPPSENFDYGTEIPLERILSNKSNMMRITANYKLNYPDRPEPTYADIYAFTKKMGYGGTGSNTTKLRMAAVEAQAKAKYAADMAANTKKVNPNSYVGQMSTFLGQLPQGLNMDTLKTQYKDGLVEGLKTQNESTKKLLKDKNTLVSRKHNLDEKGLDFTDILGNTTANPIEWAFNEKYGLKESYEFMPMSRSIITERIFGDTEKGGMGYKIENGKLIDFLPGNNMYRMDGVQLGPDNELDPDAYTGSYKIEGVFTALEGKIADGKMKGKNTLIMDTYDDDGITIDQKNTDKVHQGYGKSELRMTTVIALRNEETDDLFYQKVDLNQPDIQKALSVSMGEDDNIQSVVDQENASLAYLKGIEQLQDEEEVQLRGTMKSLDKEVFESPIFSSEGEKYYGAGSAGQENRYPLMKGFYTAFDYVNNSYKRTEQFPQGDRNVYPSQVTKAIDTELFTTAAIQGGIEDSLKSYEQGNSNEKIIGQWLQNINKDQNSLSIRQNTELAQKWMQMLSLMDE